MSPVEGWEGVIVTHSDCVCNEMRALHHRHQKIAAPPTEEGLKAVRSKVRELFVKEGVPGIVPKTREAVLEHYSGRQKALFLRAYESLKDRPVRARDAEVKMFLKDDKYAPEKAREKAPRCIQYRDKRYCLELARYLQPIESRVYQTKDQVGERLIAKGRNPWQRGADLKAKADHFANPLYLLLDASGFDAHVSIGLLKAEHMAYVKNTKKAARPMLKQLLKWQLVNKGVTKNGTKYTTPGTRMSGDMNTGLGNSVLMAAMLEVMLEEAGVVGAVYVDGDDSVVVIDRADQDKLPPIYPYFLKFGMEMKFEATTEFSQVDFCQCRPVCVDGVWVMCRDPSRVLTRPLWTTRKMGERLAGRYLVGLGLGEIAVNWGLPLGGVLGQQLYNCGEGKPWAYEYHPGMKIREYGRTDSPTPSYETRLSYFEAWGLAPAEQEAAEDAIRRCVRAGTSDHDYLVAEVTEPGYDRW